MGSNSGSSQRFHCNTGEFFRGDKLENIFAFNEETACIWVVCMCARMCACLRAHVCGGHRTTLEVILRNTVTSLETESISSPWNSLIRLD